MMRTLEAAFGIALRHHQAGHCARATAIYEEILQKDPHYAGAWHLLGVACLQRGDLESALCYITKAISLDDSKAVYHSNFGVSLRSLGRLEEAAAAYRQALAISPRYADAMSNLAVVLHELGYEEEPFKLLQGALKVQSSHGDALFNLANLYQDLGRFGDAIVTYQRALAVQPIRADTFNNMGNALLAAQDVKQAVASYRKALALVPDYAEAHLNLGMAYVKQERIDEAARCFEAASRLRPEKSLWQWRAAALCPVVFNNIEEQDEYRDQLERHLDVLSQSPLGERWQDLARDGFIPSFNLKHHGRDCRRLKEKFAALFAPLFPQERPKVRRGQRPRIGFLVTRQHEAGMVRTMAGIVEHLDRKRFEPVVLCSRNVLDFCRVGIPGAEVQWAPFGDDLSRAVEQVRAAQCDVLFHRQIGTDALNYFLPFARLAPVQCTSWGSHVTTGISAVDYFVSSQLVEPEGAQAHYTERLHLLGTLPDYQRRPLAPPPSRPSDFGLPEDRPLYLCPGHIAKFHPDQDALFRRVLEADPRGVLVLVKDQYEYGASLLEARFRRTLAGLMERVVFLPRQSPGDFLRFLSVGHVMLDTWHYSASLMAYDAFALGLPIVTLPGEFQVGRISLALYRKMGLEHLAAATPNEYVATAVQLGTDREYRESVRALICERREMLFEDRDVVPEYERFFEQALARAKDME